jgi:NAD(P)H-hydrate epimerase
MDVLSTKEMIAREQEAFRSGISAAALMEAAGFAMGRRIVEIYPRAHDFLVFVGKGNNGGDGLVVARHLLREAKNVRVVLAAPEEQLGELPIAQLAKLRAEFAGAPVRAWGADVPFPDSHGVVIAGRCAGIWLRWWRR